MSPQGNNKGYGLNNTVCLETDESLVKYDYVLKGPGETDRIRERKRSREEEGGRE